MNEESDRKLKARASTVHAADVAPMRPKKGTNMPNVVMWRDFKFLLRVDEHRDMVSALSMKYHSLLNAEL